MFALAIIYDNVCAKSLNVSKNPYHKSLTAVIALMLGLCFVITEGFRYGRGVDQVGNYGPFYLICLYPESWFQDMGFTFTALNQIVYHFDITRDVFPFGIIFVVYALIFWICLWFCYKDYRNSSVLFLLLAILATNYISEWTIRQGVSFSFILLSIHALNRRKWILLLLSVMLSLGIHKGNVVSIAILLLSYYFLYNKRIPWKITVPLFILLEYVGDISVISNLFQRIFLTFNFDSLGGSMVDYAGDSSLEREADAATDWKRGNFTQLITTLFYASIIFCGYYGSKIQPKTKYLYNAFVIGILIYEPFRLMGTLSRLFLALSSLWFIPLSIFLYDYKKLIKSNKLLKYAMYTSILYILMFYGRYVFLNPDAKYIWDI